MTASLLRCLLVVAALGAWVAPAHAAAEKRIALVVGNSAYPEAPLRNPANDARAMARVLRERGFEVILRENATKSQLSDAVADFGEKLTEGATGLFFFAGHGMQVQGRNFLIPVDARITSEQRVRLETLDVDVVLDQMAAARVRVSMVILDACRNNPFERRFRSAGGGLAQINAPEGTLIAYATAPGKVAADGDAGNGLYTAELLKAMVTPGLKVEDVFKQVRVNVSRASNGAQVPWEASSLTGDFYFREPAPVVAAPAAAPAAAAAVDREALFWESIKGSSNPAELRSYLDQYPNGTFSGLARARIASLETAAPQATRAEPRPAASAPPAQMASLPPPNTEFTNEFRAPPLGLRVIHSIGGFTVSKVDGRTVTVTGTNGVDTLFLGGFLGWRGPLGQLPRERIEGMFPLEVGKRIQFPMTGGDGTSVINWTITVKARETVSLPSGEGYETFLMEFDEVSSRRDYQVRTRHWYAPGLGIVLRREVEVVTGFSRSPPGWELRQLQMTR